MCVQRTLETLDRLLHSDGGRQGHQNQSQTNVMTRKPSPQHARAPASRRTLPASKAVHDTWIWQKSRSILAGNHDMDDDMALSAS